MLPVKINFIINSFKKRLSLHFPVVKILPEGTLFYYFGSKQDLYLYVIDAAVARVKELEGYKAKAIVAEMPKPIAPPAQ